MKICIAQTKSSSKNISLNIKNHIQCIKTAIQSDADLIIFPELSLTNYEPTLVQKNAFHLNDPRFNLFQKLSDQNNIVIGIGVPIKSSKGIKIGLIFFQKNKHNEIYYKQLLHSDELPYFIPGEHPYYLNIKNKKIAFGICYEVFQFNHFKNTMDKNVDFYIASVAKNEKGIKKSFDYLSKNAADYNIPILMANCIGDCGNSLSVGQSAIWNAQGNLLEQLDDINQGVLIYDTISNSVHKIFLNNDFIPN